MIKRLLCIALPTLLLTTSVIFSTENPPKEEKIQNPSDKKEEVVTTTHSIKIDGKTLSYQANVGTQFIFDDLGKPKASLFYIAYTKDDVADKSNRPITFCFNGGPGSAAVWLNLGLLGPKRIVMNEMGTEAKQPFQLTDNEFSLLDVTDLVFIDPVSTGFSRSIPADEAKQFHGVKKDIDSIAEFIRLYVTRANRWDSPKFLAGESYGTTRAAGLVLALHDTQHMYFDGIMLISSVLNFQTINFSTGNDLPYILFLPSYTATALYHKKLSNDLQKDTLKTLAQVEEFANGEYAHALMLGNKLDPIKRKSIIEKLSSYTGISADYIDRSDLRLHLFRFAKELLKEQNRLVGRFDSRIKGIDLDLCNDCIQFDPSMEKVLGPFTATFNNYVRTDLNWKVDEEYKVLANVQPWEYDEATNQFLDVGDKLKEAMSKNTLLDVFVASGYTDLATPYFATEYTFSHLGLDPSFFLSRESILGAIAQSVRAADS